MSEIILREIYEMINVFSLAILKLEIALTRRLHAGNVSHVFLLSTYMTYLSLIMPRYCRAQKHVPESMSVYVKVFGMDVELNIFLH